MLSIARKSSVRHRRRAPWPETKPRRLK